MEKENNDLDWFIQWVKEKEWWVKNSLCNEYIALYIEEANAEYQKEALEDRMLNECLKYPITFNKMVVNRDILFSTDDPLWNNQIKELFDDTADLGTGNVSTIVNLAINLEKNDK